MALCGGFPLIAILRPGRVTGYELCYQSVKDIFQIMHTNAITLLTMHVYNKWPSGSRA